MKKNIILLAVFLLTDSFSFQSIFTYTNFKKILESDLDKLFRSTWMLNHAVHQIKNEFLIENFYSEFPEDYLNGTQPYHIEFSNGFSTVLALKGLQVLDEAVSRFGSEINSHLLSELLLKFESHCQKLLNVIKSVNVNTWDIIETIKFHTVRISTLGISGFDTPFTFNKNRKFVLDSRLFNYK